MWRVAVRRAATVAAFAPLALAFVPTAGEGTDANLNLIPFRDLIIALAERRDVAPNVLDVVANAAVFAPIGAVVAGWPGVRGPSQVVIVAAAISASVELLQAAFVPGRATDVTDVVTNVIGAVLGAAAGRAWGRRTVGR